MDVVTHVFVALHLLSMAAIVGLWFAHFRTPTVTRGQLVGACGSLVTGLALTGFAEMAATADDPVNHAKIGVKAVLAVVVLVAAIIGVRKARTGGQVPTGLAHAVGGTAVINVLIATLWM
ncbi:MAG TPA: hypothetical protein VK103_00715 [Bacillota bacterium]|nr:hypothetical protein [Bacillota bacterium]